jgi:hypothetical protein
MSSNPQQQQSSSMSSFPSPLIWFLLLDSVTGEPYKKTTVSSLLRSSLVVPAVDQFRKTVNAENSAILTGITSSQLLVYKNKDAFVNENRKPLKSSRTLNGLGETEENALIVVVPDQGISSSSNSQDKEIISPIFHAAIIKSFTVQAYFLNNCIHHCLAQL